MVCERNPCMCVSTRTGSFIIGWVSVVIPVAVMIFGLYLGASWYDSLSCELPEPDPTYSMMCLQRIRYYTMGSLITVAVCVAALLPPISLLYGTFKERPAFLIPFIAYTILWNIGSFVGICKQVGINALSGLLLTIISGFFSYLTVVVCFHFMKLRNNRNSGGEVKMSDLPEASIA